jgi:two-component system chemotaxis sensor kinase CheA
MHRALETETMDEAVREFLQESTENLDRVDRDILDLEQDPSATQPIASLFRTIHTIKGTCGFFGFVRLEKITHTGENILGRVRDGKLAWRAEIGNVLLEMVDEIRRIMARIDMNGEEGAGDDTALLAKLSEILEESAGSAKTSTKRPPPPTAHPPTQSPAEFAASYGASFMHAPTVASMASPAVKAAPPSAPAAVAPPAPAAPAAAAPRETPQDAGEAKGAQETTVRVHVELLDKLVNLVGELVLVRNQVLQYAASIDDPTFAPIVQRLGLMTTELQEGVMKTRMQPMASLWGKLPRIVRDVAVQCGKRVRLDTEGAETELDRTLIEAVKDPLVHILRNGVDHGIESPEDRVRAGKNPEGRLLLRAFHENGLVVLEIIDDGRGLNQEAIRAKALERGLATEEQLARMSERDVLAFIFHPGFSTAAKVTNISGRGVGMDVVKTNVERIGGTVELLSRFGSGTTVRIKLPLTLAIVPALIVRTCGASYAIPEANVLELVRVDMESANHAVEYVLGSPVYRLRDKLLPLVELGTLLRVDGGTSAVDRATGELGIVVLQSNDRLFGLIVDEISDIQDIVVKPLARQLKQVETFAGATILGDGRIALILDVMGVAKRARLESDAAESVAGDMPSSMRSYDEGKSFLVCAGTDDGRFALPLELVARLEEFPAEKVERLGGRTAVQYRGHVMPLIDVESLLGGGSAVDHVKKSSESLPVIVFSRDGVTAGLAVHRVVDVVEEVTITDRTAGRPGVHGYSVVNGRVTEVLDPPALVRRGVPWFFDSTGEVHQ